MGKRTLFLIGVAATLAAGALWHGPLGAGARLAAEIEARSNQLMVDWDVPQIKAKVANRPLSRHVLLTGPADDFQRREIKRLGAMLPGGAKYSFVDERASNPLPLVVEAELLALLGFALGLIIAYLGELRRRSHQWDRF